MLSLWKYLNSCANYEKIIDYKESRLDLEFNHLIYYILMKGQTREGMNNVILSLSDQASCFPKVMMRYLRATIQSWESRDIVPYIIP